MKKCLPQEYCDVVCDNDWDCMGVGDICCSAGNGVSVCMPPQACSMMNGGN